MDESNMAEKNVGSDTTQRVVTDVIDNIATTVGTIYWKMTEANRTVYDRMGKRCSDLGGNWILAEEEVAIILQEVLDEV